MPLSREQKSDQVDWISTVMDDSEVLVVVANNGLTVSEFEELRGKMREKEGAGMKVVKNRLAKIALNERDGGEALGELFTGPTFIAYSTEPATAPKVLVDFAKGNEKAVILGGLFAGQALDADGVDRLSKMPSREEIIGQIAASLTAPGANISSAAGAPAANIAGILKTLAEKEDA